jgi:outer membrane protein OmpA-like peptidoglycan-associated protein
MRRFALPAVWCAVLTGWLFCSPLLSPVAADETAKPEATAAEAKTDGTQASTKTSTGELSEEEREARDREWDLRAGSTYLGPAGGIYVLDAASGAAQSFRLQAITNFFYIKDYLYNNDKDRYVGSALSVSVTPIKYLEFSAAFDNRSNSNSRGVPKVLSSIGNMTFDVKAWGEPVRGFALGGDVQLAFRSGPNKLGVDAAGTSFGLRGNLSLDLRKMTKREAPLILRGNFGYYFDQSAKMVENIEDKRYGNLPNPAARNDEYRHLVRRDERLAFGINRVDHAIIALGLEVPLKPAPRFALHPIAEWQLDVPVNRQGFDCPYITGPGGKKLGGTDSCLADEGVDTFHQSLTAGLRMYPAIPGLNILLAAQLGVGGTTNFVQELAPNAPYRVILAAGYTADVQKKKPEVVIKEVEKLVEVQAGVTLGRIKGTILEQGADGVVVANAKISFPGRDVSRLLTAADGTFVSFGFVPGDVQVEVEADGYETGNCTTTIPPAGGDVSLACMITALPRVGTASIQVFNDKGAPLPGVSLAVTGPDFKNVATDSEGRVRLSEIKPGEYKVRIEHPGYLVSVSSLIVKVREETQQTIQLVATPKVASVKIQGSKITVKGTIYFSLNTAKIESRSDALLTEIANVLMSHPELLQVEIQGHTDDTGMPTRNSQLSQERAEAVKDWLSRAGVERDRLLAKGYGAEKPVAPNLNERNRARNRRVEFVILQQAGGTH